MSRVDWRSLVIPRRTLLVPKCSKHIILTHFQHSLLLSYYKYLIAFFRFLSSYHLEKWFPSLKCQPSPRPSTRWDDWHFRLHDSHNHAQLSNFCAFVWKWCFGSTPQSPRGRSWVVGILEAGGYWGCCEVYWRGRHKTELECKISPPVHTTNYAVISHRVFSMVVNICMIDV